MVSALTFIEVLTEALRRVGAEEKVRTAIQVLGDSHGENLLKKVRIQLSLGKVKPKFFHHGQWSWKWFLFYIFSQLSSFFFHLIGFCWVKWPSKRSGSSKWLRQRLSKQKGFGLSHPVRHGSSHKSLCILTRITPRGNPKRKRVREWRFSVSFT